MNHKKLVEYTKRLRGALVEGAGKVSSTDAMEIVNMAVDLLKAMNKEYESMPKSYEAPKTVDAAGRLKEKLKRVGLI